MTTSQVNGNQDATRQFRPQLAQGEPCLHGFAGPRAPPFLHNAPHHFDKDIPWRLISN
ncbi:hypothetical protein JJB11_23265 [Ramlibacter ginsenosidimutans]|uniref:Uncharacterized protein n=1 Tax=Ramlibacter ginsenosidimutans TaxID=502333 RepID=A0A934TWM4_9BURK|nr:hypothetical protein [Ramlibacter ginsenosidimutans]MBK6009029.1 hypothetical protein [Ramlibacter ginsenosidimutans]